MTVLKKRVEVLSLARTIEDIPNLLRGEKQKFISQFSELEIENRLKYFNARWREVTDNSIRNVQVFDQNISIYCSTAEIESKVNGFSYDTLIAHSDIIRDDSAWKDLKICHATFVAEDDQVHTYLLGSTSSIKSTKSNFFRNNKVNREIYGEIEHNLPQYQFENDFYIWLMAQVGSDFEIDGIKLVIKDITGWKGNSERNEGKFSGECSRADSDVVTRAFILSKEVSGVQIHLELNEYRVIFTLYNEGSIEFISSQCADYTSGTKCPIEDDKLLLLIYKVVIPILREKYNSFMMHYGIDGIENILQDNKNMLRDILEI